MRLSTARRLVLEALFAAEGPVSAVYLAAQLALDATSVYRNLEVLERHGLIRHVHLGHGPGLYALVGRHEDEFLYCDRCGKVTPVTPDQLDPLRRHLKDSFGYEVRFTHFALVGLCAHCTAHPRPSSGHDGEASPAVDLHDHHGEQAHEPAGAREHMHSHGDHIHSHPHAHAARVEVHEH